MKPAHRIFPILLRLPLPVVIWISLLAVPAPPAAGQTGQEEGLPLKELRFEGNAHFSDDELREQLFLVARTGLARLQFWRKGPLYHESMMQRDLRGLLRFYQREGFIHVRIEAGSELKSPSAVRLTYHISEGTRVAITSAKIMLADSSRAVAEVWEKARVKMITQSGAGYSDAAVQSDLQSLNTLFANQGYAYVETRVQPRLEDEDRSVHLLYEVTPGPRCLFGAVTVRGDSIIGLNTIKKQLALRPGQPYSQKNLEKSQRQVYQLGVFQYVTVKAILDSLQNPLLPVTVQVKAAPPWTIKTGAGYGMEDQLRLSLDIRKRTFLGGARRLDLYFKHSHLEPYSIDLKITQFGFPGPQTSLLFNPFFLRQQEPGFTVDRTGVNIAHQQRFATYTDGSLRYTLEQDYLKVSALTREQTLDSSRIALYHKSYVTLAMARDNSLPLFYPRKGLYTAATITWAGVGFRSDFHFLRLLGEVRHYQRLGRTSVLATRLKAGSLRRLGPDRFTPLEERFYAGGASSVRGYAHSEIGPKNSAGNPIGGNSLLELGAEIRRELAGPISGALFFDAGNVWQRLHGHTLGDLHTAAGAGLRYRTPIGPIRLDLGWPLGRGDNGVQVHLSVGQAF
ncbi:MAG TPA: BamA/TamA family outer membrane protein [bacterium]|nr:BamA/TamA family outer membrane protein [bacterium]